MRASPNGRDEDYHVLAKIKHRLKNESSDFLGQKLIDVRTLTGSTDLWYTLGLSGSRRIWRWWWSTISGASIFYSIYRWRNSSMTNFGGALLKNGNLILSNKLQVKQHAFRRRCPIMLNKNFGWGPCVGRLGTTPWPSLRTSPGWGVALMLLGEIDALMVVVMISSPW